MFHIDVRYLRQISGRLRNFTQKSENLWNASCKICGDSATNEHKARLYFFKADNTLLCKCHNCQFSAPFGKFLQIIDASLHKQYCVDRYLTRHGPDQPEQDFINTGPTPLERFRSTSELSIPTIADLPLGHYAKAYINARLIPEQYH